MTEFISDALYPEYRTVRHNEQLTGKDERMEQFDDIKQGRRKDDHRPAEPLRFEDEAVEAVIPAPRVEDDNDLKYSLRALLLDNTKLSGQKVGDLVDVMLGFVAAHIARQAQPSDRDAWISVDDEHKPPVGRTPILVAVSFVRYGEYEDGTPGEWPHQIVAEGEYIPQHGEAGDYFTCYSSPHGDGGTDCVTHWMPLPAAPALKSEQKA